MKSVKYLTELLELPAEITLNLPLVTIIGNTDLQIENYKGIIEYASDTIRIATTGGVLRIIGEKLLLRELTAQTIRIGGNISGFEYV
ncbi:hypothetical protein AGMMS49975_16120 [Clostridia bacterium]|nr:hypothetical protein AGMMS49975_16120 [Clostridia bacterium]